MLRYFLECRFLPPHAELPSLYMLTREGRVLRLHQIFVFAIPTGQLDQTGPKNYPISTEDPSRDESVQTLVHFGENLSA